MRTGLQRAYRFSDWVVLRSPEQALDDEARREDQWADDAGQTPTTAMDWCLVSVRAIAGGADISSVNMLERLGRKPLAASGSVPNLRPLASGSTTHWAEAA